MVIIALIVLFFGWLVWFSRIITDLIVGILALKTKVILIIIYTASRFFYSYFRVFFSPLVTNLDYFTGGRAKVYGVPAIRYNK
jgi:hypothetical protein